VRVLEKGSAWAQRRPARLQQTGPRRAAPWPLPCPPLSLWPLLNLIDIDLTCVTGAVEDTCNAVFQVCPVW